MVNWRKPVIFSLLRLRGSKVGRYLREIEETARLEEEAYRTYQRAALGRLLRATQARVAYYRDVLADCWGEDGGVDLTKFARVPFLTKEIVREQADRLYAAGHERRGSYANTSGGSTGELVRLLQDKEYEEWNTANKLYFNAALGKQPGDGEIKLWGSDRDILAGSLTRRDRVVNWLYNRRFSNAYRFGDDEIAALVALNNRFRPRAYWAYMEAALELARYVEREKVTFVSPAFIVSTIGPLTAAVRETIEGALGCKVYNQYGSREVGALACECRRQQGLHCFDWSHYIEIVDAKGRAVKDGPGELVVTTLRNYSMPLIRYKIGDVARGGWRRCGCGRYGFVLEEVLGRTLGYFKQRDGTLVHSHFLVQALFDRPWLKRFQLVQTDYERVLLRAETVDGAAPPESEVTDVAERMRVLMGRGCELVVEQVAVLERSASGKFIYTICEVE